MVIGVLNWIGTEIENGVIEGKTDLRLNIEVRNGNFINFQGNNFFCRFYTIQNSEILSLVLISDSNG